VIQSHGFDNPKDAGAWVSRFKQQGAAALDAAIAVIEPIAEQSKPRAIEVLEALKLAEEQRSAAKRS
jgi:hypothetical protein